jgi:hypothetical protein
MVCADCWNEGDARAEVIGISTADPSAFADTSAPGAS